MALLEPQATCIAARDSGSQGEAACVVMVTSYTSERKAKRSLHVLTGAKRSLGTTTAPASLKHSMADPMAVSSWKTAGVSESLGFTVFLFLMRGSCSTPLLSSRVAFKLGRFTHRLLVLKYLCLRQVSKSVIQTKVLRVKLPVDHMTSLSSMTVHQVKSEKHGVQHQLLSASRLHDYNHPLRATWLCSC